MEKSTSERLTHDKIAVCDFADQTSEVKRRFKEQMQSVISRSTSVSLRRDDSGSDWRAFTHNVEMLKDFHPTVQSACLSGNTERIHQSIVSFSAIRLLQLFSRYIRAASRHLPRLLAE